MDKVFSISINRLYQAPPDDEICERSFSIIGNMAGKINNCIINVAKRALVT